MAACGKGVVLMQFRVLGLGGGKMLAGLEEFYRFIRFDVGDGSKIKFWYDVWCGDQALTAGFLELYSISRFKEASVADDLQFSNDTLQWNITFIRSMHDGVVNLIILFFNVLYSSS